MFFFIFCHCLKIISGKLKKHTSALQPISWPESFSQNFKHHDIIHVFGKEVTQLSSVMVHNTKRGNKKRKRATDLYAVAIF